jgi:hypothetical protein
MRTRLAKLGDRATIVVLREIGRDLVVNRHAMAISRVSVGTTGVAHALPIVRVIVSVLLSVIEKSASVETATGSSIAIVHRRARAKVESFRSRVDAMRRDPLVFRKSVAGVALAAVPIAVENAIAVHLVGLVSTATLRN